MSLFCELISASMVTPCGERFKPAQTYTSLRFACSGKPSKNSTPRKLGNTSNRDTTRKEASLWSNSAKRGEDIPLSASFCLKQASMS